MSRRDVKQINDANRYCSQSQLRERAKQNHRVIGPAHCVVQIKSRILRIYSTDSRSVPWPGLLRYGAFLEKSSIWFLVVNVMISWFNRHFMNLTFPIQKAFLVRIASLLRDGAFLDQHSKAKEPICQK